MRRIVTDDLRASDQTNTSSMDVITSVAVTPMRVPMHPPHRTASGVVEESPLVAVDIRFDSGLIGHGLIFTYTVAALKPTAELVQNISQMMIGRSLEPAAIEHDLAKRFLLLGAQGLVGMALAALDMALWDAKARLHECSLSRLLGYLPKRLPAYGAIGFDGVGGSAATARDWMRMGFKGVKAKIGYPSVKEDLEVVRAIRAEIGPDHALMLDYNQCLLPSEAIARIREFDTHNITWFEEPTLAHDFRGHAEISAASVSPIQCGENWWGSADVKQAIDAKASDYIMLDVMKVGGVTGWMRAAALVESHGILVSSHLWPEISAQLLSSTPTAHWLEYANWWNDVIDEPLEIDDGFAVTSDLPGSGISWKSGALERFRA